MYLGIVSQQYKKSPEEKKPEIFQLNKNETETESYKSIGKMTLRFDLVECHDVFTCHLIFFIV